MFQPISEAINAKPRALHYSFKRVAVKKGYTVFVRSNKKGKKETVDHTIQSVDEDGDRCPTKWYSWEGETYAVPCLTTDSGSGGFPVMHKLRLGPHSWLEFDHRPGMYTGETVYIHRNQSVESSSTWIVDKEKYDGYPHMMIDGKPLVSYEDNERAPLDPSKLMETVD